MMIQIFAAIGALAVLMVVGGAVACFVRVLVYDPPTHAPDDHRLV